MSKATMRFETALDFLNGEDKDLEQALLWLQKTFDVVESPEEVSEMAKQLASASDIDPAFKTKFDSLAGKNQLEMLEKMIEDGAYDKAEPILLELAEAGDAEAMYLLGDLYGEKDDDENADKWMLLAYENGSATAKRMAKSVFEIAEKNAEADDAHWASLYTLAGWLATGKMCHGWPCEKNVLRAVELYEKVFAAGQLSAAIDIAHLYDDEDSGIKDDRKQFEWWLKAAKKGHSGAQFSVGACYLIGEGVEKDGAKAVEWFYKAAKQGNESAMHNLGDCFLSGQGVSEDMDQAVVWYAKAAKAGNIESMERLGELMIGPDSEVKDVEKGVEWLTKAAEAGNADAQFGLGLLYLDLDDLGTVGRDVIAGLDWLKKAVAQGNGNAEVFLGVCYAQGLGVEKDLSKAKALAGKALEHGVDSKLDEMARDLYKALGGEV